MSALSRNGYQRTDDGRFFADEEKRMAGVAAAAAPPKPNNETVSARRARACCSAPRSRSTLRSAAAASDGRRCAPQKRLAASEATPVECAWAPVASRIVDHRGQGAMQMKGNVRGHAHDFGSVVWRRG